MILFGLAGGLGNALFCLPAIRALSKQDDVSLYVDGDYPMAALFRRCVYAQRVLSAGDTIPAGWKLMHGQYAPRAFAGTGSKFCGWPRGTAVYPHPEWRQILVQAGCDGQDGPFWDWIPGGTIPRWDFGIVPGCKPGPEWVRKKYKGMADVAAQLKYEGHSVAIFGRREDSPEPIVGDDLRDKFSLEELPEQLRTCRVVIGTDSGVTHLASSLGVPVVIIYTATCLTKGAPLGPGLQVSRSLPCAPCQSTLRWRQCIDWQCREIVPSVVAKAAMRLRLLSDAAGPRGLSWKQGTNSGETT